ncbi:kinesin-like protein 98A isoform X2 [Haematobia irritans]|uniref:kinesin-like protein 98A isoform X2 n=1 Tax=Haematobia irritans TaxID=7368 RepID=UPI003F4F5F18
MSSSIKVAVRVRPFNSREEDMDAVCIVEMDNKKTRLSKPKLQAQRDAGRENYHDFTFDYSYWSFDKNDNHFATQEQVYNDLGTDVIDCAFQGYNACVFAYGQTGSGKTFTMMGAPDNPGLIPRICSELFARMRVGQESGTGYKTHASYLEIYNERVKDLLGPQTNAHGLRVREHRTLGPYVENLSQHSVADFDEIQECITRGNIQRTTASTNMNDTSSRSHAIFTITFVQAGYMNDMPSETVSKIHLVDLAGSERANATGATGQRLKEGAHINKSLVTLGSVISALAEQTTANGSTSKRVLYIPYRDSILTWLLKDSLGGNSKTIMIAALSPADCNYSETLSTLRYANRAKNIINKPTINEDPNVKLIRELRDEINKLKSMLSGDLQTLQPSLKMLEDLQKKEAQEKVLTEEWTEKWKEAQSILQEQKSLGLRKSGVGVVLDSEMPHLIGIHNDITTGVTLYSLKEGETFIGTDEAEIPPDIELTGDGIRPQHCTIILKDGICTLHPSPLAQCWLNAHLIDEPTNISQGDIILLGRTNIFRFNNPTEAARLRKEYNRSQLDMSRLSLITSSRENLLTSSFCLDDDSNSSMSGSMISSPSKRNDRQYYPTKPMSRDDPELQDENRKILETIENALKQLNIERVQMHDQYKTKVQKLTDELRQLEKEEKNSLDLLRCREEELLARKDMLLWEKNNEKVQIDIKVDPSTPLSDELLLQAAESLDLFASQFIKDTVRRNNDDIRRLDEQVANKESILSSSTAKIAQVDENLLQIEEELQKLLLERKHKEMDNENQLALKKESLQLQLSKKGTTDMNVQTESDVSYSTCDTFHTAQTNLSSNLSSPTIADDDITPLSNCTLSSGGEIEDDDDTISDSGIRKSKTSSPTSSTTNSTEPNSTSSAAASGSHKKLIGLPNAVMSDSGVCLDPIRGMNSVKAPGDLTKLNSTANGFKGENVHCNSDDETASCSSCEINPNIDSLHSHCPMHNLRRKIAAQKALIMKNLEMNVNKAKLDEQIAELQDLQKRYVIMEKQALENVNSIEDHHLCCNPIQDYDHNEDDNNESNAPTEGTSSYMMPSMTRSWPSVRDDYAETEHFITVPTFVIRGAGKQTHYEYEVRIALPDGKLNILRRYSRFRELHMSMKNLYGAKIAALPFPRRELFASNSEAVAKHRRRLLELYLRRLFVVCSRIPQCPIYEGPGAPGLTRKTLADFSPFFKKGLFENGRHGTG